MEILKYLREQSGMAQADLGRLLGNHALCLLTLNVTVHALDSSDGAGV